MSDTEEDKPKTPDQHSDQKQTTLGKNKRKSSDLFDFFNVLNSKKQKTESNPSNNKGNLSKFC